MLPVHFVSGPGTKPLPFVIMEPGRLIVSGSTLSNHLSDSPLSKVSMANFHSPSSERNPSPPSFLPFMEKRAINDANKYIQAFLFMTIDTFIYTFT